MSKSKDTPPDAVDYLYKEYVRLSDRCISYVQSSFDDIRLYSAIGSVLAWAPIANSKLFEGDAQPLVLLLGFLCILAVFIILSIYNALKQSLVVYYLKELRSYELEIRDRLGLNEQHAFRWTETYTQWRNTEVKRVGVHLYLVIVLIVVVFPTVVLVASYPPFAWLYLSTALVLFGAYFSAARIIFKRLD